MYGGVGGEESRGSPLSRFYRTGSMRMERPLEQVLETVQGTYPEVFPTQMRMSSSQPPWQCGLMFCSFIPGLALRNLATRLL
jgi:hypothetical protein